MADDGEVDSRDEEHADGPDGEDETVGEHLAELLGVDGEDAQADVVGECLPDDDLKDGGEEIDGGDGSGHGDEARVAGDG